MNEDLQLFRISDEIWKTIEWDDVKTTMNAMIEAGIFNPPYNQFAIEVREGFIEKTKRGGGEKLFLEQREHKDGFLFFEYNYDPESNGDIDFTTKNDLRVTILDKNRKIVLGPASIRDWFVNNDYITNVIVRQDDKIFKEIGGWVTYAALLKDILIVVLATKNIKQDKILNRDIKNKKVNKKTKYRESYPYTTTISIGKISESMKLDGEEAKTLKPHWRRGHLRNQHYGPNNELMKQIFINPVFVNATEGWIAQRKAYNVRIAS